MKCFVAQFARVVYMSPKVLGLVAVFMLSMNLAVGSLAAQDYDLGLDDEMNLNFDVEPVDTAPTGGEIATIATGAAIAVAIGSALAAIPFFVLLRQIPKPQRLISQAQIWLLAIPGWNLLWSFVVAGAVNRSYRNALMARALSGGMRGLRTNSNSTNQGVVNAAARSAFRVPSVTLGNLWAISFALSFAAVALPYIYGYLWPTGLVWLSSIVLLTQYYRRHNALRSELLSDASDAQSVSQVKRAA